MNIARIQEAIGYAVALVTGGAGILVLTGYGIPEGVPTQLRIMFGIVLVLLGGYRASITYARGIQNSRDLSEGDDNE